MIDNRRMLDVFQRAGFRRETGSIECGVVQLSFDIAAPEGPGGAGYATARASGTARKRATTSSGWIGRLIR
jgi:hypothetical protein